MESLSYHVLRIRLPSVAMFPAIEPTCSRDIKITSLVEFAVKYPSLKIAQGGSFLFQGTKQSYFAKFSALVLKYD